MENIVKITDKKILKEVASLADKIWHDCYANILSPSQIDYMVNNFQSEQAMASLMDKGALFYSFTVDGNLKGYLCFEDEGDALLLSKLYLDSSIRGKGYGSMSLSFAKDLAKQLGYPILRLHVNKYNTRAITAYKANGLVVVQEVSNPIGEGYYMDDYVMEYKI